MRYTVAVALIAAAVPSMGAHAEDEWTLHWTPNPHPRRDHGSITVERVSCYWYS